MPPAARFLQTNSGYLPVAEPPDPLAVDSDVVVVLAALLCALVCVLGLALVARCAWLRRPSGDPSDLGGSGAPSRPPPDKGLKKKALRSLPKLSYDGAIAVPGGRLADCPICLAEFVEGDEIRILPPCGHGFHVACVDTWLGSHSSCPSCRRILVVAAGAPSWCRRCGASSDTAASSSAAAEEEGGGKAREDGDANRFLP
ncbi:RING-H2 finger protein ATL8-like [Phoenix dactylifera]|uniref:RING-H2 finger protein ATL8-like n=1 Tax=Phoenix dactylifera TaxID=42345 RepID=A0A8B7BK24_PHODC|nr:RING-H2 finger protein ATL8-like [Phoenix dactylifera]